MKKSKIVYWVTTSLICFALIVSGYGYLTNSEAIRAFDHLGFPDYFRIQLAICKIIGGLLLISPFLNGAIKEFCYAGTAISFGSAFIAHYSVNDSLIQVIAPIGFIILLGASYYSFLEISQSKKKPS